MERIEEEKEVVQLMISLYCKKYEGNKELCPNCLELMSYACQRLEHCRYSNAKPTCRKCSIHCYRPDMEQRIKDIMRWSGPRMIFSHPIFTLKHLLRELR